MRFRLDAALAFVTLSTALLLPAVAQEEQSVLEYLSDRAAKLDAALSPPPDSRDAWETYRAGLCDQLQAVLGLPDREPMRAVTIGQRIENSLVFEEVAYSWAGDTSVSATVIRAADTAGWRPAVVIPSGNLGHYTRRAYRPLVDALARHGFLVLCIDDPRIGRRQAPHAGLYATAGAAGTSVAAIQVFDALRGLDYLLTRRDVDPGRIGIVGVDEGALQAFPAAALEARFQFLVAVGGTTTYQALMRAAADGQEPLAPSASINDLLTIADMDRIAACVAPRPVLIGEGSGRRWPKRGRTQVLRTMRAAYALYDAGDQLEQVPSGQDDGWTPFGAEIIAWLKDVVGEQDTSTAEFTGLIAAEYEQPPQLSVLQGLQARVRDLAEDLPIEPQSLDEWQTYRARTLAWLRERCDLERLQPGADRVVDQVAGEELITERISLGVDGQFSCPAVLMRPAAAGTDKVEALVLSHDDRQSAASPLITAAATQLVTQGYWVIVPDHASPHSGSLQRLGDAELSRFYGDEAADLYGPADVVGMPPLALRVVENLAAVRHLRTRAEVDVERIVIAGQGVGALDAALAAALDERIAGVTAIDVTTMRDWAEHVAPGELDFFHIMPYLPGALRQTDFDLLLAAVAPRPLCVTWLKNGWPPSGFEQCAATTAAVYRLLEAEDALLAVDPRKVTEDFAAGLPDGVQRQLVTVARTLLPAPPQPGLVGNRQGLRSRGATDSAAGLIWLVAEMDGYDQEFVDGGYRLRTWSLFNDNGDAQQGRVATPLIFKRQGDGYELIGIGTTRTNVGSGLQAFEFEPVAGTDAVGEGCFFGWHTGDIDGQHNPGVAEYDNVNDCRMVILTADGEMAGQRIQVGATYREQSAFPRRYGIMAVSEK